jgi:general nucleoside transport system permease protein
VAIRGGAGMAALAIGAIFLAATGHDPWRAYREMTIGALGSSYAIEQTMIKAIPLMLTGLGVALAFTMGLWNIGAEGQLVAGAMAASWLALTSSFLPALVMLPGLILVGAAGGAVWAFIPAVLKAFVGVNEIISTLMLNYIALLWVDYMVFGSWADPTAFSFPYSRPFPPQANFPVLLGDIHLGLVFALVAAAVMATLLQRTHWGYEIRAIGASLPAARYAGMRVQRNVLLVMAASGVLAGLAGVGEVSGVIHRIQQGISPGYGFTAIIIAWVARLNPWAVVLVAVLFAALLNGGFVLQTTGVPAAIAYMIQALVLFLVLASECLLRRVRRRRELSRTRADLEIGR